RSSSIRPFFQNNGCPEPITAEPCDPVENVKGNRNICGISDGLAELFLHPWVVNENVPPVFAMGEYPVRHFLTEHMVTADKHDHCRSPAQGRENVMKRETAIIHRNRIGFRALPEIGL